MDVATIGRPVVQALMTADTLLHHYVQAIDRVRGSLGTDDERQVQSGDANTAYASAWEHLDQARALLAAEGQDVSAYDRYRVRIDDSMIGVAAERRDLAGGGQLIQVQFNVEGARLAQEAGAELKRLVRGVDWARLDAMSAAPVADIRSGAWKVWLAIALFLVLVLLYLYLTGPRV